MNKNVVKKFIECNKLLVFVASLSGGVVKFVQAVKCLPRSLKLTDQHIFNFLINIHKIRHIILLLL